MLRLMGAACVVGALTAWGVLRGRWYQKRVRCLSAWQSALLEGERLLCDLGTTTPDFLARIGHSPELSAFARACLGGLEAEETMCDAWSGALEKSGFPITREELEILSGLGGVLGSWDGEAQRQALVSAEKHLEQARVAAVQERDRLGRMWPVLGICAGLMVAAVFY